MGEMITLTAEDGHKLAGYRATPREKPRGGLVVIQEIFGVNSHIKSVTDGFAAEGYLALAPAIFDRAEPGFETGYRQEDIDRGRAVRMKISLDDMVKDIRAAARSLTTAGHKVGVVGYCLGGSLAWLSATRIDGLACTIGYYGGAIAEHAHENPRCPVLLHWGETDQSIPPDHWKSCPRRTRRCRHTSIRPVTVSAVMRAGVITSPAPSWRGPARWTS